MGIPWKKVGSFFLKLGKSGLVPIPGLPAAIEGLEEAYPHGHGGTKLEQALAMADALLSGAVDLGALTPEQAAELKTLQTNYINHYVAIRNLEAQFVVDAKALKAFIDSLKK